MQPNATPADARQTGDIRTIRRSATGILIALTVIYVATFLVETPGYWVLHIRAMAEAGMIGGLADWFAVEALFRHPLRIPLPHTALLPRNQKRAAKNIARFIDDYFLLPDHLAQEVHKLNPVRRLAQWLATPKNAELVAREISKFVELVLKHNLHRGIGVGANRAVRGFLKDIVQPADISGSVTSLLKDSLQSTLMDEILLQVRLALDENRDKVTRIVEDRSRWWIASAVDQQVVKVLVDGILSVIDELSQRDSELRQDFDTSLAHLISDLHDSGKIEDFIVESQEDYMESDAFAEAVSKVIAAVLSKIQENFEQHPDRAADLISLAIKEFADALLEDPKLESQMNVRLTDAVHSAVHAIRPTVVSYVTQIIEDWDTEDLVVRMENEVGRDLQFIRINGAVLGALVGGCLHVLTHSFA